MYGVDLIEFTLKKNLKRATRMSSAVILLPFYIIILTALVHCPFFPNNVHMTEPDVGHLVVRRSYMYVCMLLGDF